MEPDIHDWQTRARAEARTRFVSLRYARIMADPSGQIIEVPIRVLPRRTTVLSFSVSSHGARKGLADTALRTADSGYLTRRLVDVSQDVIIREDDCCTGRQSAVEGMLIEELCDGNSVVEPLGDRILGRYTSAPVVHPETGEVILGTNELITYEKRDENNRGRP